MKLFDIGQNRQKQQTSVAFALISEKKRIVTVANIMLNLITSNCTNELFRMHQIMLIKIIGVYIYLSHPKIIIYQCWPIFTCAIA